MLGVRAGGHRDFAAPDVGEHRADDVFHLAGDLDEVAKRLVDFVLLHALVAGEHQVFALGGELGEELLPHREVESPKLKGHLGFALGSAHLGHDVVAQAGGAIDDDGFDRGLLEGLAEAEH